VEGEGQIKVRFEVHRSPVGHSWHIRLSHANGQGLGPNPWLGLAFFEGTRLASDSGDLVVQRRVLNRMWDGFFKARAWDTQTGQTCKALGHVFVHGDFR